MYQHGSKKKFFIRNDLSSPSSPTFLPNIQIILNRNFSIRWINEPFLQMTTTMEKLIGLKFVQLEAYIGGIRSIAAKIEQINVGESRIIEEVLTIKEKSQIYRFVCTHISVNAGHTLIILTGEDITTKNELEHVIKNSEIKFKTLVNNIPGIVYRLNIPQKKFEFYNDQFTKITGYIPEPISPEYFSPLIPLITPEDRDLWNSVVHSSLITGDPYEVEYRIQHINGNFLNVIERGQPIYDDSNNPLYIDGIIFDISDNKRLEQTLHISEQNYRILTESSPDMIFVVGKDEKIHFVNSVAAKFLHLPAHKILGKPLQEISNLVFPPDIGSVHLRKMLQIIKTGESLRSEVVIQVNNKEVWQDIYLVPLPDENSEPSAVLCISHDITEKKKMEQRLEETIHELNVHQIELEIQNEELKKAHWDLEESRDKFIELYDFAPVGYFTLSDKAIIIEVNLTGASMLGIARCNLILNRFRRFVRQTDHDLWDHFFFNILKQVEKQVCILQIKRVDETMFFASIEGILITRRDGSREIRFVISDVSK
jgi:PAS domain S-box-containing protein